MTMPQIVLDPEILTGQPIVAGTRLSVDFVIGLLADGLAEADILANYPALTHVRILACLAHAQHA